MMGTHEAMVSAVLTSLLPSASLRRANTFCAEVLSSETVHNDIETLLFPQDQKTDDTVKKEST